MMNEQQQSQLPPHSGGQEEGQALAAQIAEAPERLRKRLDVAQVLDGMRKGVLVELRIRRPRFTVAIAGKKKMSQEMTGLEKLGLALSEEAQRVLYDYFSLGRHSLLPREWQEQLNVAETGARQCLAEHSIKTHWGAFVPAASYQRWNEANEGYQERFMALKDRILEEYDQMRATVEADYRRLAEDAWAHMTFGRVALQAHNGVVSEEMLTDLSQKLGVQEAHDQFIEQYIATIESLMPTREQLSEAFEYEYDLSYIPLPSHLVASTSIQGDREQPMQHETEREVVEAASTTDRNREQLLQEAQVEADREVIEARRQAEIEGEAKKQADVVKQKEQLLQEAQARSDLEVIEARRQAELEMIEVEAKMHADVIKHAQEQKERLVSEFYADVVGYINERISEVCHKTRMSLEKNGNALRGPNAQSLRDLVELMENLNIVGDQHIEEQVAKLREALPPRWENRAPGVTRLDTSRLEVVVREMEEQAEQVLLELDLMEAPRGQRARPLTLATGLIADEPRRTGRSTTSVLPIDLASTRSRSSSRKKA